MGISLCWQGWRGSEGSAFRFASQTSDCVRLRRGSSNLALNILQQAKRDTLMGISLCWQGWRGSEGSAFRFASQTSDCVRLRRGSSNLALNILQQAKRDTLMGISLCWQGWRGSNSRMTESKSVALPLGYIPILKMSNIKRASEV